MPPPAVPAFVDAVRLCRLALTVCAALAGLWGLTYGFLALLVWLARLDSFGAPWLAPARRAEK